MLPVAKISRQIGLALTQNNVILSAPPGAGKSTRLPLDLLDSEIARQGRIIMLQPRRLAAVSIANYLAEQCGEKPGQTIGYRVRGEAAVSQSTRLEIVTEGVLTRLIQADPELAGVSLLIFDEFHERSLHADLGLALSLEVQASLRDDLRLLVMSATLNLSPLTKLLPEASQFNLEGRQFPVETHYMPTQAQQRLDLAVNRCVRHALSVHEGSILVFMPGVSEIERCVSSLSGQLDDDIDVYALHGRLTIAQQQKAIAPASSGRRKVVFATNLAQTSLTIEGISVVIDSGLEKRVTFDPQLGVSRLSTVRISQAAATQRQGRAGRLSQGTCYRLWSAEAHQRLVVHDQPQICTQDVSDAIVEAAVWGSRLDALPMLDVSPHQSLLESRLQQQGVLDQKNRITPKGKQLHQTGVGLRIAPLVLWAMQQDSALKALACAVIVTLETGTRLGLGNSADITQRLTALQRQPATGAAQRLYSQWLKKMSVSGPQEWPLEYLAEVLCQVSDIQLARQRQAGNFTLSKGAGAFIEREHPLANASWLLVAETLKTDRADQRIVLAQAISEGEVKTLFADKVIEVQQCEWVNDAISCLRIRKVDQLVIQRQTLPKASQQQLADLWKRRLIDTGVAQWPIDSHGLQILIRMRLMQAIHDQWPDMSDAGLIDRMDDWLMPFLSDQHQWSVLQNLDWRTLLLNQLDWQQQQRLEQYFPEKVTIPTGRDVRLDYLPDGQVLLAVKIQEMYGLTKGPTVANGQRPVTLSLLSPAGRPLQTTADLEGFWQGSYRQVQKEMKGRYPKHYWPDDPAQATPTNKTKKNM